jgi:hypothetical protein
VTSKRVLLRQLGTLLSYRFDLDPPLPPKIRMSYEPETYMAPCILHSYHEIVEIGFDERITKRAMIISKGDKDVAIILILVSICHY